VKAKGNPMEIGPPELLIILLIVLLIFGPGRIAQVGRELGASIRQFRQGVAGPPEPDEAEQEE
jgi:sec-independent protein translocase protein TatA